MPESPSPIDENQLKELLGDGEDAKEALGELIQLFFDEAPKRFEDVRLAVQNQSAHDLEENAHALKSISSNLCALGLQSLCFELEKSGRENQLNETQNQFSALEKEYEKVVQALKNRS